MIFFTKYYSADQIMKNEMGGTCGMYGRQEACIQGFGGETRGKKDPGVGGKIILKLIFKKCNGEAGNGFIWLRIGTGEEQL